MNLNLSDVQYFTEVASTLNVTKAAKYLGISQPSLSLSIRRLEKAVGVRLLMRSKSGVQLTKAGLLFQARAKELIGRWEELRDVTSKRDREIMGKYTLGCHAALGIYTLPSFLPGLLRAYPQLEIELTHALSRQITESVIEFRLDFGIVVDPRPHPDLVIRKLGTDEVGFFANQAWNTKGSEDTVLVCDPSIYQTQVLLKELAARKISFKRHLYTHRLDIVTALVDAGAGIGILPVKAAERIRSKPLTRLTELPRIRNTICLIYRAEAQSSPASKQIARYIEEYAKWEKSGEMGRSISSAETIGSRKSPSL